MTRRTRTFAAWLALLALVFAQLATAAYACPQLIEAAAQETDCGDGVVNANLCERHCDYGNASLDTSKTSAAPDLAAAFVRPLPLPAPSALPRAHANASVATGPPPTRFTVLRI